MERFHILALGGDGIGPEVLAAGLAVAEAAARLGGLRLEVAEDLLHGAAWEAHGTFCRDETLAAARAADAVLVGAVGGRRWDHIRVPGGPEMQDGLMRLRKGLDAYAFVGLGVWVLGFGFEAVADLQKSRFRAELANKAKADFEFPPR